MSPPTNHVTPVGGGANNHRRLGPVDNTCLCEEELFSGSKKVRAFVAAVDDSCCTFLILSIFWNSYLYLG